MTCVPILKGLLTSYDTVKYIPIISVSFGTLGGYFKGLELLLSGVELVLTTIAELGCKTKFTQEAFIDKISEKINNFKEKNKINNEDKENHTNDDTNDDTNEDTNDDTNENGNRKNQKKSSSNPFSPELELCRDDAIKCCDANNYISIADTLSIVLDTGLTSKLLKSTGLYPSFTLVVEALYESALLSLNDSGQLKENNLVDKKIYLRKLLQDKINKIPDNTKNLIKQFLESGDEELIHNIQKQLDTNLKSNNSRINDIKNKLSMLDENMIEYAIKDKSKYIPGKSLFKTVFKFIFVDVFCNISSTSNASIDVIREMGEMNEITDMLKAGTSTGLIMAIIYFITYIIIIICGIFNVF